MDKEKETPLQELATEETTEQTEETTQPLDITAELKAVIDEQVRLGIKEALKEALKGKTPRANIVPPSTIQKREFKKMTYKERLQLFHSDPHTYNRLVKEVDND